MSLNQISAIGISPFDKIDASTVNPDKKLVLSWYSVKLPKPADLPRPQGLVHLAFFHFDEYLPYSADILVMGREYIPSE